MIQLDLERVRSNARQATTEDLLDRATVYRAGMEAAAFDIIERELHSRGVSPADIEAHEARRRESVLTAPDGTARRCSFCHRPAVAADWGWHRLWGLVPVFPRRFLYCGRHRSSRRPTSDAERMPGG